MAHDLHSLLAAARDDAPPTRHSVDDITTAGRRLARRRRRITMLSSVIGGGTMAAATAFAFCVAVFGPPSASPLDPDGRPDGVDTSQVVTDPAPSSFGDDAPFTLTYAGYRVGDLRVTDPLFVTSRYQQSYIRIDRSAGTSAPGVTTPADDQGSLVVFQRGAFDPSLFSRATKTKIRGRQALLQPIAAGKPAMPVQEVKGLPSDAAPQRSPQVPMIAWQYSDNGWAAVFWTTGRTAPASTQLTALATGLLPGAVRPARVPYKPGYLPAGMRLTGIATGEAGRDDVVQSAYLSRQPLPATMTEPVDLGVSSVIQIDIQRASLPDEPIPNERLPSPSVLTASPSGCQPGKGVCQVAIGGTGFWIELVAPTVTTKELQRTADSLTFADPTDQSGWPPASQVLQY